VVDGEHYPPVIEAAIEGLRVGGREIAAVVMAGGREKLPASGVTSMAGVEVRSGHPPSTLGAAIQELAPELVVDLSDEPVLDYRRRHELVSIALFHGVPYEGADFYFSPPPRPRLASKPTIAVIGTGKRSGKTAVTGLAARSLAGAGHSPVVVAMGRGGPADPEVLRGDALDLSPTDLLAWADAGKHAASDYIEDALLARVPTVGCRRCGGGLAGGVAISNVAEGIELARHLPGDVMILEGSGSAIPPVHADVTGLVVPDSIPPEYLLGYLGPYRLLLCDFVFVTMGSAPSGSDSRASKVASLIKSVLRSLRGDERRDEPRIVRTVFRPTPTRSVKGASVVVATTAPEEAGGPLKKHLEIHHGCLVTGVIHSLADRERLEVELEAGRNGAEVLLCEVKAAAVDVATRWALEAKMEVVYMDNVPHGIEDDDPVTTLLWAGALAMSRFR
jgi:cyclic 2,3-diphosphoglycerate synthetase